MDGKTYRGISSKRIFELMVELLASLGASKTTIKAVVALLPEPQQQWQLMDWISKTMENHKPVEGEILEKAIEIEEGKCPERYEIENGVGIIPEGTTAIGTYAFYGERLTSVTIPESVRIIREDAFGNTEGLVSITIPVSVQDVDGTAFCGCADLECIIVAEGNPVYDSREGCNAIIETAKNELIVGCMNTVIPSSVKIIGDSAFCCCYNLTSIIIPEGVTIIGSSAFNVCTDLASVNIPASVTTIDCGAFCCCDNLTSVTISKKSQLTTIGEDAFGECGNLISINLPAGVKSIGEGAFSFCDVLRRVSVPAGMTDYFKGLLPEELHEYIVEEN